MSKYFIECAVNTLILRHEDDRSPTGRQCRTDVAKCEEVVLYVLHYVQADYGVELPAQFCEVLAEAKIAFANLQVGTPAKSHPLTRHVLLIDIARDVEVPSAGELPGHVADACAQF